MEVKALVFSSLLALSSSFTPHYKSILNGLTATQEQIIFILFSSFYVFPSTLHSLAWPHLYFLMPINLILLLSLKMKKKSNLCFGLCWTFISSCAIPGVVVVFFVFHRVLMLLFFLISLLSVLQKAKTKKKKKKKTTMRQTTIFIRKKRQAEQQLDS